MTTQKITETSPASVGALQIIADKPGVTTEEIAKRGGWSVYHMRNVLRYLRRQQRVTSKRITKHCQWWSA